jgi:cytosine/adenosine deaminase-related metal-dependent hydrolase
VPAQGVALSGLEVVNPAVARRPGVTLVARGERIDSIAEGSVPGASDRFAGCTALPGLIDVHVHHPPAAALGQRELFALLFLAHGVTTVRDTGSFDLGLASHRRRIDAGERPGPRTLACGAILDGDPPIWPGAWTVATPEEAEPAVAALAEAGSDCVKVYNRLSAEALRAIQQAAARRGLRVVAHVPTEVPFETLGSLEVQHLMGLTEDWTAVPDVRIEEYVDHSVQAGLSHTPTLVAFERASRLTAHAALQADPEAALLPRVYRESLWSPLANPMVLFLSGGAPWRELGARVEIMQRTVRRLHEAGVPVFAGTDTMNPFVVPGAALHEEIRLLAAAGLGPEGALAAATWRAGEALGIPGLGRLEEGAPADLALFRRDPTRDLGALGSLVAVVARGRLYERDALLAAAARQRDHFDRAPYAPLFAAAARAAIRRANAE